MANLSDLLSEQDKAKMAKWAKERKSPKHETDIPPELYTIAELGYFYGWGAVEAFYRGFIESKGDDGAFVKLPFTLAHAMGMIKAARKLNYRQIIDNGDILAAANLSSRTSGYAKGVVSYANAKRREINGE